jgi:hypothetical protein
MSMIEMTATDRIRSFARRRCPRAILTLLLDGGFHPLEDFCTKDGKPFYVRTARYWVRMLVQTGYIQGGVNIQKDGRKKVYHIPPGMMGPVEDLLRRVPEMEPEEMPCPKSQ